VHDQAAAAMITDKYHKNVSFSLVVICVEWAGDHFGLGLT